MDWTLVTGGGKGLGEKTCLQLADNGYSVVVHYRKSENEAQEVVRKCREKGVSAECIQGDFASLPSTLEFVERYTNRFTDTANLINNVGNYFVGNFENTPIDTWQDLFHTNMLAPAALIKGLFPFLKKAQGNVINIGVAGIQTVPADIYSPAYTFTKLGLWMLTKSLAKEWRPYQVRVNMVSPGYLENSIDLPDNPSKLPFGRTGSCDEIVRMILFLLDSKNNYMTGQNIEISGGLRL